MVRLAHASNALLLATSVLAHPGGSTHREVLRRQAHLDHPNRRSVQACKRDLVGTGWVREQHQRRETRLHELRVAAGFAKEHGIVRRDAAEVEETYGVDAACTLDPEVGEGPYWVSGELIRQDIVTGEGGAITHLDVNIIDVSTCTPVTDAYVEMWGANSTGVYIGVQARGNGDGSATAIVTNALRGVQPTSANGTATFVTVIPGHYVGRTNHLHTIIHHGAKLLPNNTIEGGTVSHAGQFYIEQNLLNEVEKTAPYNTNTQAAMNNDEDFLYKMGFQGGDDPVMKISLIGNTIEDGLYATIDVGVNPKATIEVHPVNRWTAEGGVPVEGSPWAGYPDTCQNCGQWGPSPPSQSAPAAE
ncbi:Protocatechuate dioxygenase [Pyrenophora tritici-repentis]|nr:hypothetical protein Alg130_00564 [Pyrenophora tritici-repentis]KAI0613746.1 Protocatechuate dioxygenase [Pyrenophora tritici-repentis]KAI0624655.1 Protocatechuate dioxygenase [Pyrenophora tritici-repentis]